MSAIKDSLADLGVPPTEPELPEPDTPAVDDPSLLATTVYRYAGPDLPTHLTKHREEVTNAQTPLRSSRECWCLDCMAHITIGSEHRKEYGHAPDCEHSIRRQDWHGLQAWGDEQ